jgi:hypothetical protein
LAIQLPDKERKYLKVSGPKPCGRRKIFKQDHPPRIEVIPHGKNIQMPLLPKLANHLERIPGVGQRQGQTEKVQEMREKIYPQGEG